MNLCADYCHKPSNLVKLVEFCTPKLGAKGDIKKLNLTSLQQKFIQETNSELLQEINTQFRDSVDN